MATGTAISTPATFRLVASGIRKSTATIAKESAASAPDARQLSQPTRSGLMAKGERADNDNDD